MLYTVVDWVKVSLQVPIFDPNAVPTAIMLAGIVNRLVAMLVTPLFDSKKWDKTYIMYVAIALGILAAFGFQVNILALPNLNPYVGMLMTGVLMGGGANWIHDLTDRPTLQSPLKGDLLIAQEGTTLTPPQPIPPQTSFPK